MTTPTTTKRIAGHTFRLVPGVRYWASRPMAERGMRSFDVTVEPAAGSPIGVRGAVVPGLSYDQANALINAFNDGESSWDGRVWA